jgi:hypothetical protein
VVVSPARPSAVYPPLAALNEAAAATECCGVRDFGASLEVVREGLRAGQERVFACRGKAQCPGVGLSFLGKAASAVVMSFFSCPMDVNLNAQRIPKSKAPRMFVSLSSMKTT